MTLTVLNVLTKSYSVLYRPQWPRGIRRGSAAARLLGLRVRIPPGAWMSVSCECCLSGSGPCVGPITRPEESYRLWCVSACDREASILRRPWPTGSCRAMKKKKYEPYGKTFREAGLPVVNQYQRKNFCNSMYKNKQVGKDSERVLQHEPGYHLQTAYNYHQLFFFYIFLTVRLRIILVGDQLDAQFLL